MDGERFDAVLRRLEADTSRRGALGLLAALAGVGLGLGETVGAARRKGKGKHRRHGNRHVQAAAANKVTLCHYDQEADTYHRISISNNGKAVDKHLANHVSDDGAEGDFLFGDSDCCNDDDCASADESCVIAADNGGNRSGSCVCTCTHGQVCTPDGCGCPPPPPNQNCPRSCQFFITREGCGMCTDVPSCLSPAYPPCASSADCEDPNKVCIGTCIGQVPNGVCDSTCAVA